MSGGKQCKNWRTVFIAGKEFTLINCLYNLLTKANNSASQAFLLKTSSQLAGNKYPHSNNHSHCCMVGKHQLQFIFVSMHWESFTFSCWLVLWQTRSFKKRMSSNIHVMVQNEFNHIPSSPGRSAQWLKEHCVHCFYSQQEVITHYRCKNEPTAYCTLKTWALNEDKRNLEQDFVRHSGVLNSIRRVHGAQAP